MLYSLTPHTGLQPSVEGPRPVDFLISSILQMKQKGAEIVHLIVFSFLNSHSTDFTLCLLVLVLCSPVLKCVSFFSTGVIFKGTVKQTDILMMSFF